MSPDALAWAKEQVIPREILGGARVVVQDLIARAFEAGQQLGTKSTLAGPIQARTGAFSNGEAPFDELAEQVAAFVDTGDDDQPEDAEDVWAEIRGWWEQTAHDEVSAIIAKAQEYGGLHRASDLTDLGRSLVEAGVQYGPVVARVNGKPVYGTMTDAEAQELGIYFYIRGKFGRWIAALKEGRPVSDDTLHDIGVYIRMVQRIRATGGWPV